MQPLSLAARRKMVALGGGPGSQKNQKATKETSSGKLNLRGSSEKRLLDPPPPSLREKTNLFYSKLGISSQHLQKGTGKSFSSLEGVQGVSERLLL